MKKKIFYKFYSVSFIFALMILVVPVCAQSLNGNWVGSYEFFNAENGGPSDQPRNFTTYSLVVSQDRDSLAARFTADGTQTSDEYECRVEPMIDSIKVFFVKDLGGMEEGKASPLKKGDLLFILMKLLPAKRQNSYFAKAATKSFLFQIRKKTEFTLREKNKSLINEKLWS